MKKFFSNFCFIFAFIFPLFATLQAHAFYVDTQGGPVLQLGWFAASQGKSQHVNIESLIGDNFSLKKSTDQNFLVGLGYFFDYTDIEQTNFLYGINTFFLAPTKVSGDVTQEDIFTNLSYHYSLTHYPIYFAAKALINFCGDSDMTIDLGIGPNILCASGFKEHSLDGGITIPDPHLFSSKTVVNFSATAGLGWRFNHICGNLSLEIDYRFFYLGEGKLKKNNDQLINTLRTGQCYANALFISFSI